MCIQTIGTSAITYYLLHPGTHVKRKGIELPVPSTPAVRTEETINSIYAVRM